MSSERVSDAKNWRSGSSPGRTVTPVCRQDLGGGRWIYSEELLRAKGDWGANFSDAGSDRRLSSNRVIARRCVSECGRHRCSRYVIVDMMMGLRRRRDVTSTDVDVIRTRRA